MSAEARRTTAKTSSGPIRSIAAAADPSAPFAMTGPSEYLSSARSGCDSPSAADSSAAAHMALATCGSAPRSAATHA